MEKIIDDHKYWQDRHKNLKGSVAAVGSQSFSEKANFYTYARVQDGYEQVLGKLSLEPGSKILDAGAGIGIFSRFLKEKGFKVTAADVSEEALARLDDDIKKEVGTIASLTSKPQSFDLVHSFDVLYHIVNDDEWKASVEKLCDLSRRYVVLHERFLKKPTSTTSKHVRFRTHSQTSHALESKGFKEIISLPTHVISMRLLTYRINRFAPALFHKIDTWLLDRIIGTSRESWGSHYIKVFERIDY